MTDREDGSYGMEADRMKRVIVTPANAAQCSSEAAAEATGCGAEHYQ